MSTVLHPKALYQEAGIAVIGVDANIAQAVDWSSLLRPPAAHLILNLDGNGVILSRTIRLWIAPGTASLLHSEEEKENVHASRLPDKERHRFLILSASADWLTAGFGEEAMEVLRPSSSPAAALPPSDFSQSRSMSLAERDLCETLLQPPVARSLRPAWFRAKALECFSLFGAAPEVDSDGDDPLRQRIDAATLWLREHFTEDLDLHAVARHVGCAPHYLSRLFKQQTGGTLSRKLRQIRIDRAADLLRDGACNVTEAAFEVGYNSLSHFAKAFVAEKGVRPSDWSQSARSAESADH